MIPFSVMLSAQNIETIFLKTLIDISYTCEMNQCCLIVAFILFLSSSFSLCSIVFEDNRPYDGSPCQLPDGTNGTCKTNCSLISDVRRATLCGFKRNIAIICCPNPEMRYPNIERVCARRKQTLQEKKARQLELEKAQRQNALLVQAHEKRCLERVKNLTAVLRERTLRVCLFEMTVTESPSPVPQLFPAELNEHPHMAALGLTRPDGSVLWYCGGTLIHESFVLTAAHCLANIGTPQVVRISDTDLNSPAGDELAEDYIVVTSYIPPDYKPPKYYNDIGLLRIHRRPSFQPVDRLPACIWTEHDFPENELLIMGYGAPAFSRSHNEKLYQGNLILMNSDNCTNSYESYDTLPDGIISSQICAYDPSGLIDTCEGDSGGPMQFHSNDEFRTPYLVGITSFGVLCLDGNPGVYTRMHSYLSWIENIIGT